MKYLTDRGRRGNHVRLLDKRSRKLSKHELLHATDKHMITRCSNKQIDINI